MFYPTALSLVTVLVAVYFYCRNSAVDASRGSPFPPGPPSNWLIGNILNVSPQGAWIAFEKFRKQYGDLLFFHGLGNRVLVLNTMQAVNELLERRPNVYSHRPEFTVVGELMGLGQSVPLLPYDKEWREHRKLAHLALSPTAVKRFTGVQEDLAALLNKMLMDNPDNFFDHVRLTAGRIVLSVTYGIPVDKADHEYITHAEDTMIMIAKATVPGAYLCDLLPFMKHLPFWVPFQREAAHGKWMIERLVTMPFEHVKRDMALGKAAPSLTKQLLELESNDRDLFEHRVKWMTGALYGAGGETTYATVLTFMMLMAMHPDVQKRMQQELDAVVGVERMPCVDDKPELPYVAAVIKEVMRWQPALPLSIARRSAEDDFYDGYYIPANTIVIPNVWAISREQGKKYDPDAFIPERYLDLEEPALDPATFAFGFGRRICPGKYLAENSVFILISCIAASFNITPPAGERIVPKFGLNLVSYPQPFKIIIVPRSSERADLIVRKTSECSEI
ncbi:cytochrome P450 [Crucibulum laeve]|uniref:Cytochrome P450 n=1 Tax=Crucibulum laeve TaxID=68775 RepID=A0A5C3M405_9AGAR|nr:cytochrome P450 [Crucibulum laeve]